MLVMILFCMILSKLEGRCPETLAGCIAVAERALVSPEARDEVEQAHDPDAGETEDIHDHRQPVPEVAGFRSDWHGLRGLHDRPGLWNAERLGGRRRERCGGHDCDLQVED